MPQALEGIRACIFDAYGTIIDIHGQVVRLLSGRVPDNEALSRLWRQKQLEYTWLRSLMGIHADFSQVSAEALDFALEFHRIADPALRQELLDLYLRPDLFADARPCLAALKSRGMRLAILSNGSPASLNSAIRSLDLASLFEKVISVEEVGVYKPSRRVYRHAQQQLKLAAPPEACFVSANGFDIHGAASFGFQTVRLDRAGLPEERLPGRAALCLSGLADLPALLRG